METFLGKVAHHILDQHKENSEHLAVILPSRRAVAYLKRELKEQNKSGILWMPDIFSIEDFIYEASGFDEIDPTALIIELFRIHQEIEHGDKASLESFLSWVPMMVQDFNSIDENLADASQLFTFLSEAKALEKWRPDKENLTVNEKQYVAFFRLLNTYYSKLRSSLLKQRKAYQGMAMRAVYESNLLLNHEKWQHYLFAGFYALTRAEEELIKSLKKEGKVSQLFDADPYYLDNAYHEAGKFLRSKYKDQNFRWLSESYREKDGRITITGIPGNTGQARYAGQLINDLLLKGDKNKNEEDTERHLAVILADESLLLPVLNSLPDKTPGINVTMGFPVRHTATASLLRILLKLMLEKERYNRNTIHVDHLMQLFNLPVIAAISVNAHKSRSLLLKNRKVFYAPEDLDKLPDSQLNKILKGNYSPAEYLEELIKLLDNLRQELSSDNKLKVESHSATIITDRLTEVRKIIRKTDVLENFNDLDKLLRKTVLNHSLPFTGEPLKGLQLMGMLESRALDFENIILLSVNEGFLPAGKTYNSLIPFDIRRKFGLPTYSDNDSIYAYHFYRLLQRSKNVHLLYNTEAGTLGGNEQSRFIKQLKHELPSYNPRIKISDKLLLPSPAVASEKKISIEKTGSLMQRLQEILKPGSHSGLSASGLRTLSSCSLQYYFRYVLGLKEVEEIEETIPMNVFGNAVHQVLEDIFRPSEKRLGEKVDAELLKIKLKKIRPDVIRSLSKEYPEESLSYGRNRLMVELAENLIRRFLQVEIKTAAQKEVIVLSVEEELKHTLEMNGTEVYFRGLADRIDRVNGTTRIIDYKTGNVDSNALKQNNDFEHIEDLKSGEAIQVLFYDWLYSKMKDTSEQREGGIMMLAKPKEHSIFFKMNNNHGITQEVRQHFEEALLREVNKLLDKSVPFTQTEDTDKCLYCDFRNMCNR